MIAAYGGTFDVNPMPGHVAIGKSGYSGGLSRANSLSFRIHLRRVLLVQLGAYRMGSPFRDFQPLHPIYWCLHYYLVYMDEQLVR